MMLVHSMATAHSMAACRSIPAVSRRPPVQKRGGYRPDRGDARGARKMQRGAGLPFERRRRSTVVAGWNTQLRDRAADCCQRPRSQSEGFQGNQERGRALLVVGQRGELVSSVTVFASIWTFALSLDDPAAPVS